MEDRELIQMLKRDGYWEAAERMEELLKPAACGGCKWEDVRTASSFCRRCKRNPTLPDRWEAMEE